MTAISRCPWANLANPLYLDYHDHEWGVPCHDETRLFELLNLEGVQAGLSWETVLNKRAHYRLVFDQWDPNKIARYDAVKVAALLNDPGIIRNRLKVAATISNAQAYLQLRDETGGLEPFLWNHVNGIPIHNCPATSAQIQTRTPLSEQLSNELARRGFKFVGPTISYAYLQATGIVDDHLRSCHCSAKVRTGRVK